MNDKGIILPIPRKEAGVEIKHSAGAGVMFNIFVQEDEYVTIGEAAKMIGVSKEKMRQLVEERGIEKHDESDGRYLLLKSDIVEE